MTVESKRFYGLRGDWSLTEPVRVIVERPDGARVWDAMIGAGMEWVPHGSAILEGCRFTLSVKNTALRIAGSMFSVEEVCHDDAE